MRFAIAKLSKFLIQFFNFGEYIVNRLYWFGNIELFVEVDFHADGIITKGERLEDVLLHILPPFGSTCKDNIIL